MVKDGNATPPTTAKPRPAATAASILGAWKPVIPEPEPEPTEPLSAEEYEKREAAALRVKGIRARAIRTQGAFAMGLGAAWSPEGAGSTNVRTTPRPRMAE
jgi:hypothetical protein